MLEDDLDSFGASMAFYQCDHVWLKDLENVRQAFDFCTHFVNSNSIRNL